jgi:FkbM family methyltransferase
VISFYVRKVAGGVGKVSYKKALIRLLDRPGGRFLLGRMATTRLRPFVCDDFEIAYIQGMWTRRVGCDFFPDGPRFDYTYTDFDKWKRQMEISVFDTKDFWLQHYRPQEGDVVVDVGAGRGEDTLTFSRAVGEKGRVIAIEAHPVSFAILKNFCRLNRLTNVTALHLALMDKPGTARIAESESNWMENAIECGEASSGIQVKADTLETVCREERVKDIAFLKMNIEGAEREALLGMEPILSKIGQICVACHDFRYRRGHGERYRTRDFVEKFLIGHGFNLASRPDDPRASVPDHIFGLRLR